VRLYGGCETYFFAAFGQAMPCCEKLYVEGAPDGGFSEVRLLNVSTEGGKKSINETKIIIIPLNIELAISPQGYTTWSPIVAAGLQLPFFRSLNERKSPLSCFGSKL